MSTTTIAIQPHKDNIIGICDAVGRDFGFNPVFLRLGFAVMLLVNAEMTLLAYVGLGVVVLASRLLVRSRRSNKAATTISDRFRSPTIPDVRIAEKIHEPAMV